MPLIKFSAFLLLPFLLSACAIVAGGAAIYASSYVENDRRSAGEILDDKNLDSRLENWAAQDENLKAAHLNFMVYNRKVLITGEVFSEALKNYVEKTVAAQHPKIRKIENFIQIGPTSSLLDRTKDSQISVSLSLAFNEKMVEYMHWTVENRTVYLLGQVTRDEGEKAGEIAAEISGVKRVVKLFDYLAKRPQAEIEREKQQAAEREKRAQDEKRKTELQNQKERIERQINELEGRSVF